MVILFVLLVFVLFVLFLVLLFLILLLASVPLSVLPLMILDKQWRNCRHLRTMTFHKRWRFWLFVRFMFVHWQQYGLRHLGLAGNEHPADGIVAYAVLPQARVLQQYSTQRVNVFQITKNLTGCISFLLQQNPMFEKGSWQKENARRALIT